MNKIQNLVIYTVKKNLLWICAMGIYLFGFTNSCIVSASMEPTLMTHDIALFINMYGLITPNRGDIVSFQMGNEYWTKRVIGLPGDTIEFVEDIVYVNGTKLDEEYLPDDTVTRAYMQTIYYVPEDCIFVLGDNRSCSNDSRFWATPYVPINRVMCKHLCTLGNISFFFPNKPAPVEEIGMPDIVEYPNVEE